METNKAGFYDSDYWKDVWAGDLSVATHLLLRYTLVDQLADAIGFPSDPARAHVPPSKMPISLDKNHKINQVCA
jgi:hypothetical protein